MPVFEAECPICELRFKGKTEGGVRQKVDKHSFQSHRSHAHKIVVVSFETKRS
jgi:hypothetical protein